MNLGKLAFAQVTQHLPLTTFRRFVARYGGTYKVKSFSCLDPYLCMALAQLTYRESLRDIAACRRAQPRKLYHMGIKNRQTLGVSHQPFHHHRVQARRCRGKARLALPIEPFVTLVVSYSGSTTDSVRHCTSSPK